MKIVKIKQGQTSAPIKLFNIVYPKGKVDLKKIIYRVQEEYQSEIDSKTIESASILVEDINRLELNGFGTYFARGLLEKSLLNNLAVKHESTQDLAKDPIIILGLPRTGSTYFFNLMSKDPQFRTLSYWETFRLSKKYSNEWKRKKAKVALDLTNLFSPQVRAIHEVRFEGPGECTQILTNSLKHISMACYFHLPEYSKWCLSNSQLDTYQLHKQQLALLDSQAQWLLKAPPHLFSFEDIMKVYPNAKVIHLHRDPVKVVGSASSLIAASRNLFDKGHTLKQTGDDISKGLKWAMEKTIDVREKQKINLVDVNFDEFMSDPIATLKNCYQVLQINWSESLELVFNTENASNQRYKYGKHVYELSDYGLSEGLIREKFSKYIDYFKL